MKSNRGRPGAPGTADVDEIPSRRRRSQLTVTAGNARAVQHDVAVAATTDPHYPLLVERRRSAACRTKFESVHVNSRPRMPKPERAMVAVAVVQRCRTPRSGATPSRTRGQPPWQFTSQVERDVRHIDCLQARSQSLRSRLAAMLRVLS
jgi:hypothetical protein